MNLTFLGATGTVTGSKYLVESGEDKILVDCGMFQGPKFLREKNWDKFSPDASKVAAVVLTHAHIDHSGYLPRLVREGFKGPIFCTPPTASLCEILLLDSAKLMEEEARYANKRGFSRHKPALPLFTTEDAERTLKLLRPSPFGEVHKVTPSLEVKFRHTGHILGASSVRIFDGSKSLTFSGDVGRIDDAVMVSPEDLETTDYLVVESTYGDRSHPSVDPLKELSRVFNETWARRGSVLIPAFAVGRAQQFYFISVNSKSVERCRTLRSTSIARWQSMPQIYFANTVMTISLTWKNVSVPARSQATLEMSRNPLAFKIRISKR